MDFPFILHCYDIYNTIKMSKLQWEYDLRIESMNYKTTGLRSWMVLPADFSPAHRWSGYDLERRIALDSDGNEFAYYAELEESNSLSSADLKNELFNNDLQKVNVENSDSIFRFSQRYGLSPSSVYAGKQRLLWFRHRGLIPYRFAKDKYALGYDEDIAASIRSYSVGKTNPMTSGYMESAFTPLLLSEHARKIENDNGDVRGIISELEIAQTIRLLQIATQLCMAFQANVNGDLSGAEYGTADAVAAYLENKKFLSQRGFDYFLIAPNLSRLNSYETKLKSDLAFQQKIAQAGEFYSDTRVPAELELAEDLYRAATDAYTFLSRSLFAYKEDVSDEILASEEKKFFDLPDVLEKKSELIAEFNGMMAGEDSLPEAIIAQFFDSFNNPVPWRVCENCNKYFKRYREESPGKNIRETRFCRRSCNVSFNQRNS